MVAVSVYIVLTCQSMNETDKNQLKTQLIEFYMFITDSDDYISAEILVDEYINNNIIPITNRTYSYCECGDRKEIYSKYCITCNKHHSI